jgi:hypothetical protein
MNIQSGEALETARNTDYSMYKVLEITLGRVKEAFMACIKR